MGGIKVTSIINWLFGGRDLPYHEELTLRLRALRLRGAR
jgi:hypothetical protein